MEKLNRAQKCSILGPQNLGLGGPGPPGPPGPPGSAPDMWEPEAPTYFHTHTHTHILCITSKF